MEILNIVLKVFAAIYLLVYIILAFCGKKPLKTIALCAVLGWISLAVVNLCSRFTDVYIPINAYSVSLTAAGGIPAAVAILAMRMVLGL